MMLSLLLATGLAVPAAQEAQEASPPPAKEQTICKSQARTGTRFKKQICRTKAHWEAMAETAKRQAAEDMNKPTISIDRGN